MPTSRIIKPYIAERFRSLQDQICREIELEDGRAVFREDLWERPDGGGGRTRVLENGLALGKAGVNFSEVHGELPESLRRQFQRGEGRFFATGVSIVMHPLNPFAPTIHMNVRYFEVDDNLWWFGGGIDLSPAYVFEDDARHFHRELKRVCDSHHPDYYPKFKTWADDYFFLPFRNETRGIGGIFFDYLGSTGGEDKNALFQFVIELGELFSPLYRSLLQKRKNNDYGEEQLQWQRLRRGRYAEFNLAIDRGTKFGLETGGRTESILMSLPPLAAWSYMVEPAPGSPEAISQGWLRKEVNWIQ